MSKVGGIFVHPQIDWLKWNMRLGYHRELAAVSHLRYVPVAPCTSASLMVQGAAGATALSAEADAV